jgi:hypothetical protein
MVNAELVGDLVRASVKLPLDALPARR